MRHSRLLAAAAALAALTSFPATALAAPSVTVRVEGARRTLLPATTVTAPAHGSITKGGTPAGACPAASAAGALDAATRHRWDGSYSKGLGIEVNSILGTALSYAKGSYWGFYVDGRFASTGVCATHLHAGDQLLFAAVPAKGTELPIELRAPKRATAGTPITVDAYEYTGKGPATRPLAGVSFAGFTGTTNAHGVAKLTTRRTGRLHIVGSRAGAIRSAAATVTISSR